MYSSLKDNICSVDLADIQLISKYNFYFISKIRYLLCPIDLFSKNTWVVPLEGKSVVDERFIRTLKNKIYKHMTAISKHLYFDVLDDTVDKYNNTYHRTMKMKPIYVKNDSFAKYNEESNEKDPRFKISDHVRISKYKNIFLKDTVQIGQKRFLQ